jgi:endonuclease YncB( thermonuclease family)
MVGLEATIRRNPFTFAPGEVVEGRSAPLLTRQDKPQMKVRRLTVQVRIIEVDQPETSKINVLPQGRRSAWGECGRGVCVNHGKEG